VEEWVQKEETWLVLIETERFMPALFDITEVLWLLSECKTYLIYFIISVSNFTNLKLSSPQSLLPSILLIDYDVHLTSIPISRARKPQGEDHSGKTGSS